MYVCFHPRQNFDICVIFTTACFFEVDSAFVRLVFELLNIKINVASVPVLVTAVGQPS